MSANMTPIQRLQIQDLIYPLQEGDIFNFWGAVVLGAMCACLLQGYVFAMGAWYFRQYAKKDHWLIRCTIVAILVFTTVETGLVMTKSIKQTLIHPLDLTYIIELSSRPDEYLLAPFTSISITICQVFLCWRCLRFAQAMQNAYARWVKPTTMTLSGVMAVLFGLSIAGIVMLPIRLSQASDLAEALLPSLSTDKVSFWFYYTFIIFTIIDVVIVVATTIQYRAARTGFVDSNNILDVIINLTLRNGAMIFAGQTAQLVLYHTSSNSSWVLFPHAFLSRIYAITVLTTLILPRTAQHNFRQRQADQEEAMHNDVSMVRPGLTATGSGQIRSGLSTTLDPSVTATRCTACESCSGTRYGSTSGKGGKGTPRLGYRNSAGTVPTTGAGVGELGFTIHPREKVFVETEGPVSFAAALFGLREEGKSEGKGSPEVGVDTIGAGWGVGPEVWDDELKRQSTWGSDVEKAEGEPELTQATRGGDIVEGVVLAPTLTGVEATLPVFIENTSAK